MQRDCWKAFERYVASIFCSVRNSLSGGNSKMSRSDSLHPDLFVSCKYTRHNNKTLRELVAEERVKAQKESKIAVCVIGEFDDRANSLVVMHLKDLPLFVQAAKDGKIQTNMESGSKRTKSKRTGTVAD
jgi:hypothetical protein